MAALGPNVVLDPASDHRWEDLNQGPFLDAVFDNIRSELGDAFGRHTFHILSAYNADVRPHSLEADGDRNVLVWISNETADDARALAPHYHAVFKTHLPRETPGSNVFPLNLGYVGAVRAVEPKPMAERAVSVFFSGQLTPDRRALYRALHPLYRRLPPSVFTRALSLRRRGFDLFVPPDLSKAIAGSVIRFTPFFKEGLPQDEYLRLLGDCRIALCPAGGVEPETFRHLEATRAGAVVVSQPLPSTHFYRGAPYVIVDDWTTGLERCRELLADEDRLADLHAATLRWWNDVCSERATARYVAERLRAISSTA